MKRVILVVLAVGALLIGCARDEARPEGVSERWLQEVGNQGRDGLRDDAIERAQEYGDQQLARRVIPAEPEEDERYFADLEVGKAVVYGDGEEARVSYRVTEQRASGDEVEQVGSLVLRRDAGRWRVIDVVDRRPGEEVPSEGGDRPARAALGHWALAAALGLVVTVAATAIVERQPRPA